MSNEPLKMTRQPGGQNWKERNDCVVRSIVHATGIPYYRVARALFKATLTSGCTHRRNGGWHRETAEAALDILGVEWIADATVRQSVGRFAQEARGAWLVFGRRHLTGVVDGEPSDEANWHEPTEKVIAIIN